MRSKVETFINLSRGKKIKGKRKIETLRAQSLLNYGYPVNLPSITLIQQTWFWKKILYLAITTFVHAQTYDRCVTCVFPRLLRRVMYVPIGSFKFFSALIGLTYYFDFKLMKSNSNHLEWQFWIRHILTWNVKVQKYPVNIPKCHFLSTTERNQWSLVIYDNRNLSYETAMHVPQPLKETFSYVVQIQTF